MAWFSRFHHEKLPSAIERYQKELLRVTGVLDATLQKQEWLVGNKCSYADLAFIPWYVMFEEAPLELETKYPAFWKWYQAMKARPAVSKALAQKKAAMAAGH
jgi:glutathione S-transferase